MSSAMLKVGGVVLLYWCLSIMMVFLNKHLMMAYFGAHDLSLFVSWCQCVISVILLSAGMLTSKVCRIPSMMVSLDRNVLVSKDMHIMAFAFVCSLSLNNLMLKHIGVALYQIARSFTLIFVLVLSTILLKKSVSLREASFCVFVVLGYFIAIDQEETLGTLSPRGVVYGLFASFFAALCGIYTKLVEPLVNGNSLKMNFHVNFISSVMFLPIVYCSGQLTKAIESLDQITINLWLYLICSGVLSLGVGCVSMLQIKLTSPVTHHISINAKSVTQTVIAVLYYNDYKTMTWWTGNLLVLAGTIMYAVHKVQLSRQATSLLPLTKSKDQEYHGNSA